MALQSTIYNTQQFAVVSNLADFYKTQLPEIPKVRSIFDNIKLLFGIPANRIQLSILEEGRIYKYVVQDKSIRKDIIGWFVYIPEAKRLDMYAPDNAAVPIAQWVNKRVVFKNYPPLYELAGFDKLYSKIVNVT